MKKILQGPELSGGAHHHGESVSPIAVPDGVTDPEFLRRLRDIRDLGLKMGGCRSRESVLAVLREILPGIFDCRLLFIAFLDKSRKHYAIRTLSSHADATGLNHREFPVQEGMPGMVMREGEPAVHGIDTCPVFSVEVEGRMRAVGTKSLMVVPLRTADAVTGALMFGAADGESPTDLDCALAELVGHLVATATGTVSVAEDTRRRISQIGLINEVSRQLASTLEYDRLLQMAAATIQKTLNYLDVTVFLVSPDRQELVLEAHAGSFHDFLPHGYRQTIDKGITGWVAMHGEKVLCGDVSLDSRYIALEYHDTKSEIALPIRIDREVVGVLNVEDTTPHAFDETDAVMLETLSDQLGAAIKNAKLYEELRQANMKLTSLDKVKSEFLGIIAHDFRSPLSSVILAAKALLKQEAAEAVPRIREYLQIIINQANKLNRLAEDTLSITRLEAGQLRYDFKIVNMDRLIQDAASMIRFSSRHAFEYTVEPEAAFIKADQSKLRQVLQNLMSNAVKYSPGGGRICVTVAGYSPGEILVQVSDQGMGIPGGQIENLFQKFTRVTSGEAKDIAGTGLGLWICREIVAAHGGAIWIESEEGKGTSVKLTLPREHPVSPEESSRPPHGA